MITRRIFKFIIVFAVSLSLPYAHAADEDFSGTWYITAGSCKYTMELTQRGTQVYGNLVPVNGNKKMPIIVYGKVNDEHIDINAHNTDFSLTLALKGVMTGKGRGRAISGSLKKNNRHSFKFFGIRYLNKSRHPSSRD